jgi:hypothetical protein
MPTSYGERGSRTPCVRGGGGGDTELIQNIKSEIMKKLLYPAVTHNSGEIYKNILKELKYKFVSKFSGSHSCEKSW